MPAPLKLSLFGLAILAVFTLAFFVAGFVVSL